MNIRCRHDWTITEVAPPANGYIQGFAHHTTSDSNYGQIGNGFELPTYEIPNRAGCPVHTYSIRSCKMCDYCTPTEEGSADNFCYNCDSKNPNFFPGHTQQTFSSKLPSFQASKCLGYNARAPTSSQQWVSSASNRNTAL